MAGTMLTGTAVPVASPWLALVFQGLPAACAALRADDNHRVGGVGRDHPELQWQHERSMQHPCRAVEEKTIQEGLRCTDMRVSRASDEPNPANVCRFDLQ